MLALRQIGSYESFMQPDTATPTKINLVIFYAEYRRKMKCERSLQFVFHLMLTILISTLLWVFWRLWEIDCIKDLNAWLEVFCILESIITVVRLVQVLVWAYAEDPLFVETVIMVFIEIWVYLIEAAYVVHGSTFIYSEEIYYCEKTAEEIV